MHTTEAIAEARRRARQLRKLYAHITVYVLVTTALALLNATQRPETNWWAAWVAVGWAIGVAAHIITTAIPVSRFTDWEARKVEQILERS